MSEHITRILAIRHGETAWNQDGRIQGHIDIPLNDTGRWQAQRMAEAVADEGVDVLYASDLSRAFDTAHAIADVTGLPLTAEPGTPVPEPVVAEDRHDQTTAQRGDALDRAREARAHLRSRRGR